MTGEKLDSSGDELLESVKSDLVSQVRNRFNVVSRKLHALNLPLKDPLFLVLKGP